MATGLPKDGWKQTYIEYKGYNTRYEDSKNLIPNTDTQSELIDCDRTLDLQCITTIYILLYN